MDHRYAFLALAALAAGGCMPPRGSAGAPKPAQATSCANLVNADTTVYDTADVAERPTVRLVSPLTYPPEAERKHIHGRVLVGATVNSDGGIEQTSVTVLHSVHPLLDAEAERFVKTATLWPACRHGQPVRLRVSVPVVFDAGYKAPSMQQSFLIGLGVGLGLMLVGLASGN